MDSKTFDSICDNYRGIQRERVLRIIEELPITLTEEKLFYSNLLVRIKFILRNKFEELEYLNSNKDNLIKYADNCERSGDLINAAEYRAAASECEVYKEPVKKRIIDLGSLLHSLLFNIEDLFTDHDITQIISANSRVVSRYRKEFDKLEPEEKQKGFFYELVVLGQGEYRDDFKSKAKCWLNCKEYEMPFFNAIWYDIGNTIDSSQTLTKEADKILIGEYMGKESFCTVNKDLEGNIISIEDAVQRVTLGDLIEKYQDVFADGIIAKYEDRSDIGKDLSLKLETIFDYEIEDEIVDGSPVGCVSDNATGMKYVYVPGMKKVTDCENNLLGYVITK